MRAADYRLRASLNFMSDHVESRMSLDAVAREVGMSRPRVFRLFREQCGITPHMYWDTLRMNEAFRRLVNRPPSIGDVAFDLGFNSQSNFTRFFVSYFNATP